MLLLLQLLPHPFDLISSVGLCFLSFASVITLRILRSIYKALRHSMGWSFLSLYSSHLCPLLLFGKGSKKACVEWDWSCITY